MDFGLGPEAGKISLLGVLRQFFGEGLAQDSNLRVATCMDGKRLRSDSISCYLMTQ